MKIVEINATNFGSTGKIMLQIAEVARSAGNQVWCCYPEARDNLRTKVDNAVLIGSRLSRNIHVRLSELTGLNGCFSFFATKKLIKRLKTIQPDIIHLHNLHNCYVNLSLLFGYIKKSKVNVVWTLHDCWAFTGHCPYFDIVKCDKWQTGCRKCPQYKEYPVSLVDNSARMYFLKKKWFTGVENLTIVTPSEWLAGLVKRSFLKDYPVKVINNGIDPDVFKPTPSDFRKKYGIAENKFILLGVAFAWGERKGLNVFIELAERLKGEEFQIVLVGTDDNVDKLLPENVVSIHRTRNQTELAEIYTAADLFVNPTREEVLGMVNIEAQACGTPVVTFDSGGSPECIDDFSGCVVPRDDIDMAEREIRRICRERPYSEKNCRNRSKNFNKDDKFKEYVDLYNGLNGR